MNVRSMSYEHTVPRYGQRDGPSYFFVVPLAVSTGEEPLLIWLGTLTILYIATRLMAINRAIRFTGDTPVLP